jgi:nitroreductase
MLAAATALIQVTWLPTPSKGPFEGLFEPSIVNMEHIAATAAAAQNLVLAAKARGIPSYWSSGGALRDREAFGWLDIPEREILLGSVYLFPSDLEPCETTGGSLREQRGDVTTWAQWVELDDSAKE